MEKMNYWTMLAELALSFPTAQRAYERRNREWREITVLGTDEEETEISIEEISKFNKMEEAPRVYPLILFLEDVYVDEFAWLTENIEANADLIKSGLDVIERYGACDDETCRYAVIGSFCEPLIRRYPNAVAAVVPFLGKITRELFSQQLEDFYNWNYADIQRLMPLFGKSEKKIQTAVKSKRKPSKKNVKKKKKVKY